MRGPGATPFPPGRVTELVVVTLLVLTLSAMASGVEVALLSVPYGRVLAAVSNDEPGAEALQTIKDDIARPIMALVVWNNVANIGGSALVGYLAARQYGDLGLGVGSAVLTFLVIIFGEIIPKTVGERFAGTISLVAARPVLWITRAFFPFVWLLEHIVRPLVGDPRVTTVSEEEIVALTELGGAEGVIEADEQELIERVFRLNDVTASDMMTPLSRVDALPAERPLGELREWLPMVTHSRIPVFEQGDLNRIVGVVTVRGLLERLVEEDAEGVRVGDLSREAHFIPHSMVGDDLLRHFQQSKQHLAVVVSGLGVVLGVITLEDVLEELVGEIVDETDIEQLQIKRLSREAILVDAATEISKINHFFNTELEEGGRIGERVIDELGYIPSVGETVDLGEVIVAVEEASPRDLRRLKLTKRLVDPDDDASRAAV